MVRDKQWAYTVFNREYKESAIGKRGRMSGSNKREKIHCVGSHRRCTVNAVENEKNGEYQDFSNCLIL